MRVRRATCASRSGAARTSPSAMRTTARVTLRSCHQWVELAAGPQVRQPVAQVDHLRLAAGIVGGLGDPLVEVASAAEDHVGVASASTSSGRGSYSCGSVFGFRLMP